MESRIFNKEIIPHDEKTFSLYKPHAEWINKGKAGVPIELGVKVCIMEDQFGFILNHRVIYKETDDKIAVDFLKSIQELFPKINSVSYDRGFWSKANLEAIKKLALKGMTMAVVTHEMGFARSVANEIIFMEGGKIIDQGSPHKLFTNSEHERTRKFLYKITELYGKAVEEK